MFYEFNTETRTWNDEHLWLHGVSLYFSMGSGLSLASGWNLCCAAISCMTSHRSFLFAVDCYVQFFNSLVFQCDDMVIKCREMTSRSKPWFEVATQVVFFPTEEQSTTPKGGRYFSGSLGIQLPRLFGDGPMIAGKTYRVLYRFLCVDCIMLQSSFTWDEIAFEHVQCIIDVTGFRFKATSGSETHINVAPC